jgi:hypothetical protein
MDPNEKSGSKWPKLKPPEKLEILRRYRDRCASPDSDVEHQLSAQPFFIKQVLDEGLTFEYFKDISVNGRV